MTPVPTNILLDRLIYEENSSLNWDEKLFKIYPVIKTTGDIADSTKLRYPLPDKYLLKRKRKIQIALSVLIAGFFTFAFVRSILNNFKTDALIVLTILLSLLYYVLFKNLTKKEINFEIQLSKNGIQFDDYFYNWSDIQETFVVNRPSGRSRETYFVVVNGCKFNVP